MRRNPGAGAADDRLLGNGRRASQPGVRARTGLAALAALVVACGTAPSPAPHEAPLPPPPEPYPRPEYQTISESGAYADLFEKTLARGLEAFAPSYVLFADGAEKRRFICLPPGTVIDASDVNHWTFPV
jgi:hypothetical protein